jgi:hypothetical protein
MTIKWELNWPTGRRLRGGREGLSTSLLEITAPAVYHNAAPFADSPFADSLQ